MKVKKAYIKFTLVALMPCALMVLFAGAEFLLHLFSPLEFSSVVAVNDIGENIEDAMQAPNVSWQQQPRARVISLEPRRANWQRFDIPALSSAHDNEWLYAVVYYNLVKNLCYYLVENGQVIDQFSTGTLNVDSFSKINGRDFYFKFQRGDTPRVLYVKTQSIFNALPIVTFLTASEFVQSSNYFFSYSLFLTGCSLCFIIGLFGSYIRSQRAGAMIQVMVQLCGLYVVLYFDGIFNQLAPRVGGDVILWGRLAVIGFCGGIIFTSLAWMQFTGSLKEQKFIVYATSVALVVMIFIQPTIAIIMCLAAAFLIVVLIVKSQYMSIDKYEFLFMFVAVFCLFSGVVLTVIHLLRTPYLSVFARGAAHLSVICLGLSLHRLELGRLRHLEIRKIKLKMALESDHARTELRSLLGGQEFVADSEMTKEVAIMFADVVAFSQISALADSKLVYESYSRNLREFARLIEKHHGVVDNSYGDVVVCTFRRRQNDATHIHVQRAFQAAVSIQESIVARPADAVDELILPLRIGVHATSLVQSDRDQEMDPYMDFARIGIGMKMARILCSGCSPFKIVVSRETLVHLVGGGSGIASFNEVSIASAGHGSEIVAFEFNPFKGRRAELRRAEKIFLGQLDAGRSERRQKIAANFPFSLETSLESLKVLDYSEFGFRAYGTKLMGRGTVLSARIHLGDAALSDLLIGLMLNSISLEVRWIQEYDGGYLYGLKIHGGSKARTAKLFALISAHVPVITEVASLDEVTQQIA